MDGNTDLLLVCPQQRPGYIRKRTSSLPGVIAQQGYAGSFAFQEVAPTLVGSSKRTVKSLASQEYKVQTDVISGVSGMSLGRSHHPPKVTYLKNVREVLQLEWMTR